MNLVRTVDRWLFGPGSAHRLASVRSALACVLAIRIALGPFRHLPPQPEGLFQPPAFLAWLGGMPDAKWIVAVQIAGTASAVMAVIGRKRRLTFPAAWVCLLVLGGLKGSYGKVLHNDILLLLVTLPILFAPSDARLRNRSRSVRFGWPVQASLAIASFVYFAAGIQKVLHSGFAWVTSDNMRWILYEAASGSRVRWPSLPVAIADRPWLPHLVAGVLLGGELLAPLLIIHATTRRVFIVYSATLHIGTWLTLGLDYWSWPLAIGAVLYPWDNHWQEENHAGVTLAGSRGITSSPVMEATAVAWRERLSTIGTWRALTRSRILRRLPGNST